MERSQTVAVLYLKKEFILAIIAKSRSTRADVLLIAIVDIQLGQWYSKMHWAGWHLQIATFEMHPLFEWQQLGQLYIIPEAKKPFNTNIKYI